MPYTAEAIRALLQRGEDQTVEFKNRIHDPAILAKVISAFANSDGGIILVGVGDRGKVVGADTSQLSRVFHAALATIINPPRVDLEATEVDGKRVATVTVAKGDGLTMSDLGAYVRSGVTIAPMAPAEIAAGLKPVPAEYEAPAATVAEAIHTLTAKVDALQQQIAYGSTFRGQLRNYLMGGVIGAVIGLLLSLLFL